MCATKRRPLINDGPFYDVFITDPEKVVRSIAESRLPIGAIQINLAFLRGWVREEIRLHGLTQNAEARLSELGLRAKERVPAAVK